MERRRQAHAAPARAAGARAARAVSLALALALARRSRLRGEERVRMQAPLPQRLEELVGRVADEACHLRKRAHTPSSSSSSRSECNHIHARTHVHVHTCVHARAAHAPVGQAARTSMPHAHPCASLRLPAPRRAACRTMMVTIWNSMQPHTSSASAMGAAKASVTLAVVAGLVPAASMASTSSRPPSSG